MKKEDLFKKWLDHNLTEKELEAFEQSDAFGSLDKISETAKLFKAPDFDIEEGYENLQTTIAKTPQKVRVKPLWMRYASVAAIVAICFTVYFTIFNSKTVSYVAENSENIEFLLPDTSEVVLNAGSTIKFEEENWEGNRSVSLIGEAYFKVEKGNTFSVNTNQGTVTVLGTQFNVKDRPNYFEVTCFEGLVSVTYKNESQNLIHGTTFKVYKGTIQEITTTSEKPDWILNKTMFKSIAVLEVISEIERQYNVTITTEGFNVNTLFTGSITHNNLTTAINSVAIPLGLTVTINDDYVTLKK